MTSSLFSSIGPVLAAPWQQRRNVGSLWGAGFVVFMILLGPAAVLVVSVLTQLGLDVFDVGAAHRLELAANMRHSAATVSMWSLSALVLCAWALTVSNLLDQNQPALARLVPAHAARLRLALVVAWAVAVGLVTLFIGGRFGVPLLAAALAAPVLALLALSVRWPMLWLPCAFAPVVMNGLLRGQVYDALMEGARSQWMAQPGTITMTLAVASVVVLVALIQSGGRRHLASAAARRHRTKLFKMRAAGVHPLASSADGVFAGLMNRAYFAWWRRVLARPHSPAFARLMLGLGPGVHATHVVSVLACCAVGLAVVALVMKLGTLWWPPLFHDLAQFLVLGAIVGFVPALIGDSLQVRARLQQTRREQALLVLLPGVPRGAALSRGLAWQLTGQFVLALGGAVLLACSLGAAHRFIPDVPELPFLQRVVWLFAVAGLPLAVIQWRHWARAARASSLDAVVPMVCLALLMGAIPMGTDLGWWSDAQAALGVVGLGMTLCARRWWRMGHEPEALPVGRLA